MHKTHIFDQKNNAKLFFYRPTYPILFQTVTGNKQFLFLGLIHQLFSFWKKGLIMQIIGADYQCIYDEKCCFNYAFHKAQAAPAVLEDAGVVFVILVMCVCDNDVISGIIGA